MVKEQSIFCLKPTSIMAKVLEILTSEYPLTINDIYLNIRETTKQNIKYHTVYEKVRNLERQGILEKKGSVYLINYEWI